MILSDFILKMSAFGGIWQLIWISEIKPQIQRNKQKKVEKQTLRHLWIEKPGTLLKIIPYEIIEIICEKIENIAYYD